VRIVLVVPAARVRWVESSGSYGQRVADLQRT
jgi:hypothetical protein